MAEQWIFLDVDTLGLSTNSKLMGIGVFFVKDEFDSYKFEDLEKYALTVKFDVYKQKNRTVDKQTINYWVSKEKECKDFLSKKNSYSIQDGMKIIEKYLSNNNFDPSSARVFTKGCFTQNIWNDIYKNELKMDNIIPFWCWRDVRTVLDIFTGDSNPKEYNSGIYTTSNKCISNYLSITKAMNDFFNK